MYGIRFLFIFLTATISTIAHAASYDWYSPNSPHLYGATPMEVCIKMNSGSSTGMTFQMASGGIDGTCLYNGVSYNGYIQRRGTSCPATGQTYSNTTGVCSCPSGQTVVAGKCVLPPPGGDVCGKVNFMGGQVDKITNTAGQCVHPLDADLPSTCKYLSKSTRTGSTYVSFDGSGNPKNPGPIQTGGCVATPISVDHCKAPAVKAQGGVSLGPAPALCKVGLSFSGAVAGQAPVPFVPPASVGNQDGVCYPGQDCDPADLPINTSSTPCKYEWDQSIGMQVCRSTKFTGKPGDYTGCGTGPDGKFKCYGTAPSSNGIDLGTTVKTQDNPDGTTTTTKTDTHNKVVCSGIGSCTTTTTKTTQVTIKDGNGNTTGQTTTCTGANCSQTGAGGLGDSDGDGADDCQNNDTCEGGPGGPTELPELDEQPTVAETTEAYFNRIKNAPIAQALSIAVPSGGSCAAGTAQTFFGSISFDSFCQLAPSVLAGLRYLFLAIWAWAAIRLFFTA